MLTDELDSSGYLLPIAVFDFDDPEVWNELEDVPKTNLLEFECSGCGKTRRPFRSKRLTLLHSGWASVGLDAQEWVVLHNYICPCKQRTLIKSKIGQ